MNCDRCVNKEWCYDGKHELTRCSCIENNRCCFSPIEYIEREKLIEHLRKDPAFNLVELYGVTGVIESIPAADVRPVVLCKDCKYFHPFREQDGFCNIDGMLWNENFFCSNGKLKE